MIPELLARVWYNAGIRAMNGRGDLTQATRHFHHSLGFAPASAPTWLSLGNAYMGQNALDLALGCYRTASELAPNSPLPIINIADALLKLGQWKEGWKLYETRFASEGFRAANGLKGGDAAKMWKGESLHGKTLLLFNEQGAGDTIMTMRYSLDAQMLSGAAHVILRVPASLVRLARASGFHGEDTTIVSDSERLPPHDALAPFMSLPLRCATVQPGLVPRAEGYFTVREQWAGAGNVRVGLVWAGSPGHARDSERSIPQKLFRPLLETPGISWVSLQVGPKASEINAFPHVRTVQTRDYYDTACVMKSLDLVISVDSSPAHLAGALGVPVWTLLPFAPDFRWMLNTETTCWYDSMFLARQQTRGDWKGVIDRVQKMLVERVQNAGDRAA